MITFIFHHPVRNPTAYHQTILDNLYKDGFYGYICVWSKLIANIMQQTLLYSCSYNSTKKCIKSDLN